ncbi:retinol dehydrogenase 14-like protein [Parasitella parasitica]|nr:retinol dehydrogenase 14-like protein [Parasitella parasitica]
MTENTQIKWNTSAEDLVKLYKTDLTGKVAIVTGSNSGIGLETARVLALAGATVIIPCRTLEKAHAAIKIIKESVPEAKLVPLQLDLSDLSSIRSFTDAFFELYLPLNLLVNNAGVMAGPKSFTKDGFEVQFGVNHMGHFYLTQLLTNKLKQSAPGARVVCLSSSANYHFLTKEGLDFTNLNAERYYAPMMSYGQAKFANILFAKELQRKFDAEGVDITVTSVHPGAVDSNLGRHLDLYAAWEFIRSTRGFLTLFKEILRFKYVNIGASTSIFCCVSPEVEKGEFYADNAINRSVLNEQADNKEMAKRLWDISEKFLVNKLLETAEDSN